MRFGSAAAYSATACWNLLVSPLVKSGSGSFLKNDLSKLLTTLRSCHFCWRQSTQRWLRFIMNRKYCFLLCEVAKGVGKPRENWQFVDKLSHCGNCLEMPSKFLLDRWEELSSFLALCHLTAECAASANCQTSALIELVTLWSMNHRISSKWLQFTIWTPVHFHTLLQSSGFVCIK